MMHRRKFTVIKQIKTMTDAKMDSVWFSGFVKILYFFC